MQKSDFFRCVKKLHFIGIGGVSMSSLAKYCALLGKCVTGSDERNLDKKEFEEYGIKLFYKHEKENVYGADAVVYTSALRENNVELLEAKKLRIPIIRRSQFLGMIMGNCKKTVAVSGSHGKTTTTAMISNVLKRAKRNPLCFIGGEDLNLGNFAFGDNEVAVCEACEYKKNFLDIFADIAVVLNVDNDHLDCYGSIENEIVTFSDFIKNTLAVINADDENSKMLFHGATVSFGIKKPACYQAFNLRRDYLGKYSFSVRAYSSYRGRINLNVIGKHNVYNALATVTVCEMLGLSFNVIKKGIEAFCGVKRRAEYIGDFKGIKVFADYAHHPSEIKEVIKAFSAEKNSLVIFQPHTYSRTECLMCEFIESLAKCKDLVIYKTYPARECFNSKGSSFKLYENLTSFTNVVHTTSPKELNKILDDYDGKVEKILVLGAGDIYDIAKNIVKSAKTQNKKINKS